MKKTITFLLSFFYITSSNLSAQTPSLIWAKNIGAGMAGGGLGQSIAVDSLHNVYTCGFINGLVDMDPGTGTFNFHADFYDLYIQKLDENGDFVWAKKFDGHSYYNKANCIKVDNAGNVYVVGSFQSTMDFDPGIGVDTVTSKGVSDIFIVKLDPLGNFLWARTFGYAANDAAYSLCIDESNNIYWTGFFFGTIDFNPDSGTANLTNGIIIEKLDQNGHYIWAECLPEINESTAFSIVLDHNSDLLLTGKYQANDSLDFDPGSGVHYIHNKGYNDIFVEKLDTSGNFIWVKSIGGSLHEEGFGISVDINNNIYICGAFMGTVDFDLSSSEANLNSNGVNDIFVLKLDANGNYIWARSWGASQSDDYGASISVDNNGISVITGAFLDNPFVTLIDSSGNFIWNVNLLVTDIYSQGNGVTFDETGKIYLTGVFDHDIDFDPGPNQFIMSTSSSAAYMCKWDRGVTGFDQLSKNQSVFLSPNPVQSKLEIATPDLKIEGSEVFNSCGERLNLPSKPNNDTRLTLYTQSLPSGIYLVKLSTNKGIVTKKFVKE